MRKTLVSVGVAVSTVLAAVFGLRGPGDRFYEVARTQDIQYQVMPRELAPRWGWADTWDSKRDGLRERLREHQGQSYVIKPRERPEWSRARNLKNTLAILGERVRTAPVGYVWLVRALTDGYEERARKVDLNPAVAMDTEGTVPVDIVVGTLKARFGDRVQLWGIYACRSIYSSWTLSQHAYANAADFGGTTATLSEAARYIYDLTRKDYVPVSEILWWGHNLLTGHYVYDHYNHVHFSGEPLLSGPCRRAD